MICNNKYNSSRLLDIKLHNFILITFSSHKHNKKSFKLLLFIRMKEDSNWLNYNNNNNINIKTKILIINLELINIRLQIFKTKMILFNKINRIILNLEKK